MSAPVAAGPGADEGSVEGAAAAGPGPRWLTPDWPAHPRVRALSTWRTGGVSSAPYASLNLGGHVDDAAGAVAQNRARLRAAAALGTEPAWLSQVHGVAVCDLDAGATSTGAGACVADAAVTATAGPICAILTADCLPVLLAAAAGDRVGAAHAGWRGLAAGVIEATVAALDCAPPGLMAWLGPAIGPAHFEIGAEVRDALLAADPGAAAAFVPNARGRYMADLFTLARRRLRRAGVERIYGGGECTFAQAGRYFSHRRDGRTGRQASLIWLSTG